MRPANDNRPRPKERSRQPGSGHEPASLGTRQLVVIGLTALGLIAGVVWMIDGMRSISQQEVCLESHARNCQPVPNQTP